MSYQKASETLRQDFALLRAEAQDMLYYLEGDILQKRAHEKGWSILETLLHMNLLNEHYLKGILAQDFPTAKLVPKKTSWVGQKLLKSMAMNGEKPAKKWPTPGKTDPRKKIARGHPVVAHAIFGDFWNDLSQVEKEITRSHAVNFSLKKVPALIWPLRLTGLEALQLLVLHSHRHLMQIKRIIQS